MRIIDIAPVPGDPAAMRAAAKQLDQLAQEMTAVRRRVSAKVNGMQYAGKFGNRFKGEMRGITGDLQTQAKALNDLAKRLRSEATAVAEKQAQRQQTIERLRREERERMQQAMRRP